MSTAALVGIQDRRSSWMPCRRNPSAQLSFSLSGYETRVYRSCVKKKECIVSHKCKYDVDIIFKAISARTFLDNERFPFLFTSFCFFARTFYYWLYLECWRYDSFYISIISNFVWREQLWAIRKYHLSMVSVSKDKYIVYKSVKTTLYAHIINNGQRRSCNNPRTFSTADSHWTLC